MIDEDPRVLGLEGKLLGIPGLDRFKFIQHVGAGCVKIHRMALLVVGVIEQAEIHYVALRYPDQRAGDGAAVGPHALFGAVVVDDDIQLLDGHFHIDHFSHAERCQCYAGEKYGSEKFVHEVSPCCDSPAGEEQEACHVEKVRF